MALAEQAGGAIINADSAQIYRDLPILSAAPSAYDRDRADHRLYAVQDGALPCSAADWARMARAEIEQIHGQVRLPIVVGGTGLYLRTLLEGIAPVPPIDPEVRARVRRRSVEENRAELLGLDPEAAAKLGPSDSARITRALEVVVSTGRSLTHWQRKREGGIAAQIALRALILLPPRDWLYQRCDERFERMFTRGGLAEVEALLARRLNPNLPIMRAIGLREVAAFIRGDATREQAVAAGQQATRRYAKRQYTWFAHQPPPQWARFREIPGERALELLRAKA